MLLVCWQIGQIHGFAALGKTGRVTRTMERILPVSRDMVCQGLALVGFVFTVRTVELEDASVGVLAILHLIKSHVSMSTFITPAIK